MNYFFPIVYSYMLYTATENDFTSSIKCKAHLLTNASILHYIINYIHPPHDPLHGQKGQLQLYSGAIFICSKEVHFMICVYLRSLLFNQFKGNQQLFVQC